MVTTWATASLSISARASLVSSIGDISGSLLHRRWRHRHDPGAVREARAIRACDDGCTAGSERLPRAVRPYGARPLVDPEQRDVGRGSFERAGDPVLAE